MSEQYFTIKTYHTSGFGDQLGTQFSRLYTLGRLLQLQYRYSPIVFPRSIEPIWISKIKRIIFWLRYIIVFSKRANGFFLLISKILERLEVYLDKKISATSDESLSKFIGLPDVADGLPDDVNYLDVYIDQLINEGVNSISQIRDALYARQLEYTRQLDSQVAITIFRFCWSSNTHSYISAIDSIFKKAAVNHEQIAHDYFFKKYWNRRKDENRPASPSNVLVVHIRCGDSTVINLGERKFTINGTRILTDKELKEILAIDQNRLPVDLNHYQEIFNEICNQYTSDTFQVYIISDGYQQSYHNFFRCLLQYSNTVKLSQEEKVVLKAKIKTYNSEFLKFSYFKNTRFFIGETKEKLFKSIDALADAKTLIWGSGGFAFYTHTLFKKQPSILIHAKGANSENADAIKRMNKA